MIGGIYAGLDRFRIVLLLLMKFYGRTLIRYGVLRNRMIRWSLVGLGVMWMVFSCTVMLFFVQPLGSNVSQWSVLLDLAWVSTIPWVIGAFLIVKLLFSRAGGTLRIVSVLPVTGTMRSLALKASETGMVLAVVSLSVFAVSVSLMVSTGMRAIGLACLHLALPVVLLYALLSLAWDLVGRVMHMVGLPQFASVMSICGMIAVLVQYATLAPSLVMDIQERWRRPNADVLWVTVIADTAERTGGLMAGCVALLSFIAIMLLDVALSPPQYRGQADYLPGPVPFVADSDIALFAAYVLRSRDTFLETVLAVALTVMLCMKGDAGSAAIPSCLITFTGLSQFADGIVPIWGRYRRSPAYTYLCMVCSQLVVYTGIWLLLRMITLPWSGTGGMKSYAVSYAFSYLGIVAGTLICTMLGILFPLTKRNPFTAIVGFVSLMLIGALLLFAMGLFGLHGVPLAVVLIAILAATVPYSISGIRVHQRSQRHERY